MKSIVLVSGGMDSLVCAAIAASKNEELYFLHLSYGQTTQNKEKQCFEKLCMHYKPVKTLTPNISYLAEIGGTSLIDKNLEIKDYDGSENIPNTYVPFRNAHLLCIAVSWAEVINADKIYIGAVEEDSSGYPDCRKTFYDNFQNVINVGATKKVNIETPVIGLSKKEIIELGSKLNAPFEYSWSCYRNGDKACGTCDSCHLRLNAFKQAKKTDPIEYKKN